jgi:hypothetical protein
MRRIVWFLLIATPGRGRVLPLAEAQLQEIVDYMRLCAVQTVGRAGRGRASGPQDPGLNTGSRADR